MIFVSDKSDYGDLYPLVKAAGWLMSSAGALILAWRGRSKNWLPIEWQIPGGHPARVAVLLSAVALSVLWYEASQAIRTNWLLPLAVAFAIVALAFYLINNFGITTLIYDAERAEDDRMLTPAKIIGGLWLTRKARIAKRTTGETTEAVFKGMAYRPERVWSRPSRALAQQCFLLSFVIFTLSGSAALGCGGLILLAARQPRIVEFSISPLEIKFGDRARMRWKVTYASKIELEPGGVVPESGEQPIAPLQNSVYRLTASNAFGSKSVLVGIAVSK